MIIKNIHHQELKILILIIIIINKKQINLLNNIWLTIIIYKKIVIKIMDIFIIIVENIVIFINRVINK